MQQLHYYHAQIYKQVMSNGTPYWELGRIDSYISLNPKPEKLELDLIQFVNDHSDVFSREEIDVIERGINRGFAMRGCPFQSRGDAPTYQPGFSVIAQFILQTISDKTTKREINASQEVTAALANFEACVEFIEKFLPSLCANESAYTHSGNGGFVGSNKWKCDQIADAVKQHWPHAYPNIFRNFQSVINRYQALILNLWADVLIRERKIKPETIAKMQTEVGATDGYERKMHELLAECGGGPASFKPNLDASALLKWLTLFHVNSAKDHSMSNMTKTYAKGGKASTLDGIVFGIISQFVPIRNAHGYSHIPQSNKHESELNILRLTCNFIEKNAGQAPPVYAYLSSDALDQCVQKVKRFPSTDEFMQFLQSTKAEPTPTFEPLSPSFWVTTSYEGGNRTRRRMRKKRTRVNNRRHSRHRR